MAILLEERGELGAAAVLGTPLGWRCFSDAMQAEGAGAEEGTDDGPPWEVQPVRTGVLPRLCAALARVVDRADPLLALPAAPGFEATELVEPLAQCLAGGEGELELWCQEGWDGAEAVAELVQLWQAGADGGAPRATGEAAEREQGEGDDWCIVPEHGSDTRWCPEAAVLLRRIRSAAMTFLAAPAPWALFRRSGGWVRHLQWRHLELNMVHSIRSFEVQRILGRGGWAPVYASRKLDTGRLYALKCIERPDGPERPRHDLHALHERNVLAEMDSRFVVKLHYAFRDTRTSFLALTLMDGGDLGWHVKHLGRLSEDQARFYTAQIALGVRHIHGALPARPATPACTDAMPPERGFVYRDLKPSNVLLDVRGHARISDFGLARDVRCSLPTAVCGTFGFMAPEVLTPGTEYGLSADWWSLGCTAFALLTGSSPFLPPAGTGVRAEVIQRTVERQYTWPSDGASHPDAQDAVAQFLQLQPAERLGCGVAVREHRWFGALDWAALQSGLLESPLVPQCGAIHAENAMELSIMSERARSRRGISARGGTKRSGQVPLGASEVAALEAAQYDFVCSSAWQRELLPLYARITAQADTCKRAADAECSRGDATLEGGLLERGFFGAWRPRWVRLLPESIEWRSRSSSTGQPVFAAELASLRFFEGRAGEHRTLHLRMRSAPRRTFTLRATFATEHQVWSKLLAEATAAGDDDGTAAAERV